MQRWGHDGVIKWKRAAGPLWGESTSERWIPLTKSSGAELDFFFDTPVIWDVIALIMISL